LKPQGPGQVGNVFQMTAIAQLKNLYIQFDKVWIWIVFVEKNAPTADFGRFFTNTPEGPFSTVFRAYMKSSHLGNQTFNLAQFAPSLSVKNCLLVTLVPDNIHLKMRAEKYGFGLVRHRRCVCVFVS
jgi:hypothetical protein